MTNPEQLLHAAMNRRAFLLRLSATAMAAVAAPLPSALAAGPGAPDAPTGGMSITMARELTEQCLRRMEKGLEAILARQDWISWDDVRRWLIMLFMWGPLAGWSQQVLTELGDNPGLLREMGPLADFVRWMAEPFIFPVETSGHGAELERELAKVFGFMEQLERRGYGVSLDNVGDASLSPADAQSYRNYYLLLLERFISGQAGGNELYVSLKLSALTWRLDAALGSSDQARAKRREIKDALGRMLALAAKAPEHKRVFIRVDMEEHRYKDLTLQLFRETVEENRRHAADASGRLRMGVVIQAYLRDAADDLRALSSWAGGLGLRAPVRLVKGAYLDYERAQAKAQGRISPVWDYKPSTDANYEALCAYLLLSLRTMEPVFATHNLRSIAHGMALAQSLTPTSAKPEFQMLYGMGDPIKQVVLSQGYPMRQYVPAGSLARGLKYAGRRFHELASQDNALTRTMRGDFSVVDQPPAFVSAQDQKAARTTIEALRQAGAKI